MIDEDDGRVLETMDTVFGKMNRIHIGAFVELGNRE
jgi:hypothetical protein